MNHIDRINAVINGIPEVPMLTSFKEIDENGDEFWKNKEGQLHRDGDLPAVIYANGAKYWCKNGQLHRDGDLPAIIFANGRKEWWKNSKRHRDGDQPAIIWPNGAKAWYKNGVRYEPHR